MGINSYSKPCEIVLEDFRPDGPADVIAERPLKLVQWNIERGYKLEAIIEELQRLDADVIGIQEVDVGCERSCGVDTGKSIAKALGLNYAFICEFEELRSPLRDAASQGGGVHGNAILSRYDIVEAIAVEHSHHPIDWEDPQHPLCKKEPRHGRRLTLAAKLRTPQGLLLAYSVHLEVFCGMLDRMRQFADIFRHSRAHPEVPHQVILGDLNTMANGIARLSPHYCTDKMRWRTFWWTEAQVWDRHIFSSKAELAAADNSDGSSSSSNHQPAEINAWLRNHGLPEQVCKDIVNPGFMDPFDPKRDVTLDNPKYRFFGFHLMTGKLDWLLVKNLEVVSKSMGNDDYSRSDHKWLMVEVNFKEQH